MATLFQTLCTMSTLLTAWKNIKSKNAAGSVDGITVNEFEKNLSEHLSQLEQELKTGIWSPEPYLKVEIPKKNNEKRILGLLSVKDKIVQQAIKTLIEPRLERLFLNNSYGYRPGKGATKAIRRSLSECNMKKNLWVLQLDIDNYFNTIDHTLLCARLHAIIPDEEIVRLIMLSVKMGVVSKKMKWNDTQTGIPQGAILSPILANLYFHSFDQFVLSRKVSYVRYADDFIILCESQQQAQTLLSEASLYLSEKLKLTLNDPYINEINNGFEFLGITLKKHFLNISSKKQAELTERIRLLDFTPNGFSPESLKVWKGINNYYGTLLPQKELSSLDWELCQTIKRIIESKYRLFRNQSILQCIFSTLTFLSEEYTLKKKQLIQECIHYYQEIKGIDKNKQTIIQNKQIIRQRKQEYRKKESENSELLINKPGAFIGLTRKGITVKEKGTLLYQKPAGTLSHILITGKGISLSSNLLDYCMVNKIPIDFFDSSGSHLGSFLSVKFTENTLWSKQAQASSEKHYQLATLILLGKLKNQHNLIKYFHKYHKNKYPTLSTKFERISEWINRYNLFIKEKQNEGEDYLIKLIGYESQAAIRYWDYIRELLLDDHTGFEKREHKGATDLVNSMLNYGYAILYVRVWQALLGAKLNPYESIIHVRQNGKPTFVYDVVELFRSQVVDRVVISLIQKRIALQLNKGLLDESTRKILVKGILERLNRYEKYRGKELKLEQIIKQQAREIAGYYNDNTPYKPYIAKW